MLLFLFLLLCVLSLQLPKMYPGLLMDLQVYARDVPLFSFRPGAVELDLQASIKAFAIQPNGTQTPLFKLNAVSTPCCPAFHCDAHRRMNRKNCA